METKEKSGYNAYTLAAAKLEEYKILLAENLAKPLTRKFDGYRKAQVHYRYKSMIRRYQEIVSFLKPLTIDQELPAGLRLHIH